MTGHVRKRSTWEVVLDYGEQPGQRCPACVIVDKRGRVRGKIHWADRGRLEACPKCEGELEDVTARRQLVMPGYRTKKEALAALHDALVAYQRGRFVEPQKITLGEYLREMWLPSIVDSVRPATRLSYATHVERHITPRLGHVLLQELKPQTLEAFYAELGREPEKPKTDDDEKPKGRQPKALSATTRRRVHATLRRALGDAARHGLVVRNAAADAKPPRPQRRSGADMKTWTPEQLSEFLEGTCGERLWILWRVLATTGLRRGEALGLKWSDLDLKGGELRVQRARVQVGYGVDENAPKTEKGRRPVSLDSGTVAALKAWREQQNDERKQWGEAWVGSEWVFTRENGEPLHPDRVTKAFEAAQARVRAAQKKADPKAELLPRIRLHDLRHTHATHLLSAGVHPKVVQERLGHSTISMTLDTYSHVIPALQESAAELAAALIDGVR